MHEEAVSTASSLTTSQGLLFRLSDRRTSGGEVCMQSSAPQPPSADYRPSGTLRSARSAAHQGREAREHMSSLQPHSTARQTDPRAPAYARQQRRASDRMPHTGRGEFDSAAMSGSMGAEDPEAGVEMTDQVSGTRQGEPEKAGAVAPSDDRYGPSSKAARQPAVPKFLGVPMKQIALVLLVAQTVASIAVIRYSMTMKVPPGEVKYLKQSFVFITELCKLVMSAFLLATEVGLGQMLRLILHEVLCKPLATLTVGVPAFLYVLQNNLILVGLDNLSGAVYQVTYQLKILSTALLSVLILRRHLSCNKWLALMVLTSGVALIQIPAGDPPRSRGQAEGSQLVGLVAVLSACMTSGLAGVYLEKILKDSKDSIWLRNIQLAVLSCIVTFVGCMMSHWDQIQSRGLLQGYNWATWLSIALQSLGGLIVAAVLKYADNILKCFGNAIAIVLSCLVSWLVKDFTPTHFFGLGSALVIWSTFQYSSDNLPCGGGASLIPARLRRIFALGKP